MKTIEELNAILQKITEQEEILPCQFSLLDEENLDEYDGLDDTELEDKLAVLAFSNHIAITEPGSKI